MTDQIMPERFMRAMGRKRLTAKQVQRLAKNAGHEISLRAISRYRSGTAPQGVRAGTVELLAKALGVGPDYLRGVAPDTDAEDAPSTFLAETRWTVRLPTTVRNAYSLVAWRYGIPVSCVVELAPLVFMLMAEKSLSVRRVHLQELERAYEARLAVRKNAQHLPIRAAADGTAEQIYAAEAGSIEQRDLFGEKLWNDQRICDETFDSDFDDELRNPFAVFLHGLVQELDAPAKVEGITATHAAYALCPDIALAVAGGDETLSEGILDGSIPLHEMPHDLLSRAASRDRMEWLRAKAADHVNRLRQDHPALFAMLDRVGLNQPAGEQGEPS